MAVLASSSGCRTIMEKASCNTSRQNARLTNASYKDQEVSKLPALSTHKAECHGLLSKAVPVKMSGRRANCLTNEKKKNTTLTPKLARLFFGWH